MPTIIRDSPYFDQPTRVQLRGRSFSVKRDQIILWISITEKGIPQPDPRVPRFPAILDSGCNYNLLINEQHLTAWAGIQPGYLRQLARMRVAGEPVSHLAANAWLADGLERPSSMLLFSPETILSDACLGSPAAGPPDL